MIGLLIGLGLVLLAASRNPTGDGSPDAQPTEGPTPGPSPVPAPTPTPAPSPGSALVRVEPPPPTRAPVFDPSTGRLRPSTAPARPGHTPAPRAPEPVRPSAVTVRPSATTQGPARAPSVPPAPAVPPVVADLLPAPTPEPPAPPIEPRNEQEAKLLAPTTPIVPQPPGATGNLGKMTRPLGSSGFQPEVAHQLAPVVYDELQKPIPDRTVIMAFQRAADLKPIDGIYGPRTAGALEYFLPRQGQQLKAPPTPRPMTKDKRIIPYRI